MVEVGGGRRDRTDDPLLAKQMLSQLSYAPKFLRWRLADWREEMHRWRLPDREGPGPERACCLVRIRGENIEMIFDPTVNIQKGGDPAAPSDTATLLRLHPSHWSYRGRLLPCG